MNTINFDREIDLSGEVCPLTFVKSKLELEGMSSGQILGVVVDNAESAGNVPRSMELEGNEVLSVDEIAKGWKIIVRKK